MESLDIITSLVINGDVSRLTPQQRVHYYNRICEKLGLDPLLQPFRILRLRGKEILYCDRSGAQQLNKLYKVSHEIRARELMSNCYVVTAQAFTPDGRRTESIGAVYTGNLKGEHLCNALMKAETKAKRRATLDLLGLGLLDETEVQSIAPGEPENEIAILPDDDNEGIPTSVFFNIAKLKNELSKCNSDAELITLYNDNRIRVNASPELKQLFTERKNALRKKMAA